MFVGKKIRIQRLDQGIAELVFDAQGSVVNTLNTQALNELKEAVTLLSTASDVKGLLISSNKPAFIVGADITEFQDYFQRPENELKSWLKATHEIFDTLENLRFPTVAAVNGMALGGGFELALAADYRVLATDSRVGLPEVGLGLCPGWGGTVRLSRLIGVEAALDWMLGGKPQQSEKARQLGAADQVVEITELREAALQLLARAVEGKVDHIENTLRKKLPRENSVMQGTELGELADRLTQKLDLNYPAAKTLLDATVQHVTLPFKQALEVEADCFVKLAQSNEAKSLVGLFLNDQLLKRKVKAWAKQAQEVKQGAVLGAGIMGGGIAYQSASTGTPIIMKDIHEEALTLGKDTASKLLDKQVKKGRLDEKAKTRILAAIQATLDYSEFDSVDLVIEAVVENQAVKASVLAETERKLACDAVLASNTSTISIDLLAQSVERPEQFCGIHFFNPVHQMPLVEVIRGRNTSDKTIARAVAYTAAMGKTPIVVNDCPGFLVNRILFPYFNGFNRLLKDGVDFQCIDRVMEKFGWPMGPGYLADVVGLDTMAHADRVLQAGYPARMGHEGEPVIESLLARGCLGQKNSKGFYEYGVDEQGRRYKEPSSTARELIALNEGNPVAISDQEIIDRMMIPMCMEAVRCLEDGIVESAAEVDMGLILGLGFPRFRGGALRYIEILGIDSFCQLADRYSGHGPLYEVTGSLRKKAQANTLFYA